MAELDTAARFAFVEATLSALVEKVDDIKASLGTVLTRLTDLAVLQERTQNLTGSVELAHQRIGRSEADISRVDRESRDRTEAVDRKVSRVIWMAAGVQSALWLVTTGVLIWHNLVTAP